MRSLVRGSRVRNARGATDRMLGGATALGAATVARGAGSRLPSMRRRCVRAVVGPRRATGSCAPGAATRHVLLTENRSRGSHFDAADTRPAPNANHVPHARWCRPYPAPHSAQVTSARPMSDGSILLIEGSRPGPAGGKGPGPAAQALEKLRSRNYDVVRAKTLAEGIAQLA